MGMTTPDSHRPARPVLRAPAPVALGPVARPLLAAALTVGTAALAFSPRLRSPRPGPSPPGHGPAAPWLIESEFGGRMPCAHAEEVSSE
jgi:hypothetical protein